MNEHAGPACVLSGLIVGIFAILLHDPTPPSTGSRPLARAVSSPSKAEAGKPEAPPPVADPLTISPPASPKPTSKAERPVAPSKPVAPDPGPRRPPGTQAPSAPPPAEARVASPRRPSPPSPRGAFAIVEEGETLADVAARVYGSRDASEALWKANRDQVERVDSPLARGTLLRTP